MTRIFKSRRVDVSLGDMVYSAQITCPECPTVGLIGRLVDTLDIGGIAWEVYTVVPECQKDWEETVEMVEHDTGGLVVTLSREIKLQFVKMEECTTDNSACPYTTLIYDPVRNLWTGELGLDQGTAEFEFYGVWTGFDIEWFLAYLGCAYTGTGSNAAPATVVCTGVGKWGVTGGSPLSDCCDGDPVPSVATLTGKMNPIVRGREVDTEQGVRVFLVNECCPDECQESVGCCFGERIDDQLDYTIFNIVQNEPTCTRSCSGATVLPTAIDGCATWSVTSCPGPHTICLTCDLVAAGSATVQNGWEHYRLYQGGTYYSPSSGSCDPLSVTFDNLPWTSPDPSGICGGTYSVTVTR